ncbi:MAG: hypothetical protein JWM85_3129, partial [Acidimicrobiaceae bacterium]|nr:hypothetical protein [Acidimicrobiaceae bacterium]
VRPNRGGVPAGFASPTFATTVLYLPSTPPEAGMMIK